MKLSSNDLKIILQKYPTAQRMDPGTILGLASLEHDTRFWLQWNLNCMKKGLIGHDKKVLELRLLLRLIAAYKNALAKEQLAKGF